LRSARALLLSGSVQAGLETVIAFALIFATMLRPLSFKKL
jgi:hypothetical protein